ncbi:hypothetical protein MHYP_G00084320 [Metynnis hypsauchen]
MEISAEEEYGNGTFAYYEDYNDLCNRKAVIKFGSTVVPIVFTIVALLSLIGNILVIVMSGLNLHENHNFFNIFILNLVLSDLIFTLGLPFWACYHIWGWTFAALPDLLYYEVIPDPYSDKQYYPLHKPTPCSFLLLRDFSVAQTSIWEREMENDTVYEYGDDYYINTDNEPCPEEAVIRFDPIVPPIFISIVVLLSLIGNILVLVILGLYENLKSLTNCFMFNLALSDLIFTLGLPFWACSYIWSWTFGDFMCRSVNFVFSAGFHSSIVFLMLMTIQRYIAVVHPLSDWTKCHSFAVIPIIAWVVSFSAALPDILLSEAIEDPTDLNTLYCELNSIKASVSVAYEQNIFLVLAFSVTSFCFIRILLTIIKTQTNKKHSTVRLVFCMLVVSFITRFFPLLC